MVAIKKTKKQPTPGFKNKLVSLSRYNTWPRVTNEWQFLAYYIIGKYKTCPGDPRAINHISIIINEHNNNQLEICNSCAERYMGLYDGGRIENDVRRLKANIGLSMNQIVLDYLRDNYAISNYEYEGYVVVKGVRSDSNVLRFRSDINRKLLTLTDYNNKSALDTIDLILVWIHRNPQSNMDVKALFEIRNSLITTNVCNTDLLKSITVDNKIDAINYSQIERSEAYKIFEPYLQVWKTEYNKLSEYFCKDPKTQAFIEVPKKIFIRKEKIPLIYNLDLEPDTIIIKEENEKVDKQSNNQFSNVSSIMEKTVILEEDIQILKKEEVSPKGIAYSKHIDDDPEDDQPNLSFKIHLEEQIYTSKLLSPKTTHKISKLIIKYLNGISNETSIETIIKELCSISDKNKEIEIWSPYFKLDSTERDLYDLLIRLKFGVVSHILKQLLCKYVNASEIALTDVLQIPIVQDLIEIFSDERMYVKCITESKPTIYYDWMIGPRLNPKDFHRIKFIRNKKDGVEGLNIKDLISRSISFDVFYSHFYNWILYLVQMDSIKEILYYIDDESLWEIYNQDEKKDSFRDIFDLITVECFNNMLTNIFRKFPHTISTNIKDLNTYLIEDYIIKYDQEQECTFIDKVYHNSEEVEIAEAQSIEPIDDDITSNTVVEVKDFSYLLASNNDSRGKVQKSSLPPGIGYEWIESWNKSIEQSKQYARDLNKIEKETDILILDSITSQSLHLLESFISKYLNQLTSSSSIQMFVLTFDHIEISDVYEANPNITSLYTFMSKLSLGCITQVLTQLLSQRLNKSEVNVSDIFKNPMVIELKKILSNENIVLKYKGYARPIQSFFWIIEPL